MISKLVVQWKMMLIALCSLSLPCCVIVFADDSKNISGNKQTQADQTMNEPSAAAETDQITKPNTEGESQRAWKIWHHQIDELLIKRGTELFGKFGCYGSLTCVVHYVVTKDGKIVKVELSEKTANMIFNALAEAIVKSLQDDPVLLFPVGSNAEQVEKAIIFTCPTCPRAYEYVF